jgi:uncharacterized protein YukE
MKEDPMSVTYGAVPEQLTSLGTTMKNQIEPINSLISTVTGVLASTTWTGPARDQFEDEWNTTFRTALTRLSDAFQTAGTDCINRSTDLQRAMGAR